MKLPVIIPADNEKDTIEVILQRVLAVKLDEIDREVIGNEAMKGFPRQL
jgi:hypothetical protein